MGDLQIPQVVPAITLGGRESKVIVTNYAFGSSRLLYSTASVFFAGEIGGRDVLFLHGNSTEAHEVALTLEGKARMQAKSSDVTFTASTAGRTIVGFLPGIEGLITVWDSDKQLVLFSDSDTAGTFWNPVIAGASSDPFKNYWQIGTNTSVLVGGPYLVRNASISGSQLELRGDLNTSARLTVIAPSNIRSVTWNGRPVSADVNAASTLTSQGGFIGQLEAAPASTIAVPKLNNWKFAESLPEIQSTFSDASWTVANHTTTNIPFPPYYGDGRILYGCDYELYVVFSNQTDPYSSITSKL